MHGLRHDHRTDYYVLVKGWEERKEVIVSLRKGNGYGFLKA